MDAESTLADSRLSQGRFALASETETPVKDAAAAPPPPPRRPIATGQVAAAFPATDSKIVRVDKPESSMESLNNTQNGELIFEIQLSRKFSMIL